MMANARRTTSEQVVYRTLKSVSPDYSRIPEEVIQAHLEAHRQRHGDRDANVAVLQTMRSLTASNLRRASFYAKVRKVRAPTLVVHGEKDRVVPLGASRRLVEIRPDWELHVFPGLGHVPMMEDPQGFLEVVRHWLAGGARPPLDGTADNRRDLMQLIDQETIRKRLRAVPEAPGCYLLRDGTGKVIYVGKALRLRDRLRSYFTAPQGQKAELMKRIHDFEVMRTANEVEALVLECNLIKNYRPRFNIRLKDDKNYLYLKLPMREDFPRVHYTRRIHPDGAIYFGPYTSAQSLRQTVKSIRQLLPFRTCSDEIFKQGKVCLDFHIKRCPGPCEQRISRDDYRARIQEVALLMEGRSDLLARDLHARMEGSAEKLDFENAARYRDQLQSIEKIADRQKVLTRSRDDQDLIAYARQGKDVFVDVAYIRSGKMVGHDGHPLEGELDVAESELLRSFLVRYYSSATHIPRTIVLTGPIDEAEQVTAWLEQRRGGPVTLEVPQKGRKRQLVKQLAETAAEELKQLRIQWDYDRSRTEPMLQALAGRPRSRRAAAPDRVLRHLQHPGRLRGRGDGRLRGRPAS